MKTLEPMPPLFVDFRFRIPESLGEVERYGIPSRRNRNGVTEVAVSLAGIKIRVRCREHISFVSGEPSAGIVIVRLPDVAGMIGKRSVAGADPDRMHPSRNPRNQFDRIDEGLPRHRLELQMYQAIRSRRNVPEDANIHRRGTGVIHHVEIVQQRRAVYSHRKMPLVLAALASHIVPAPICRLRKVQPQFVNPGRRR